MRRYTAGDYFDVADCVVMMESFAARDATAEARSIAQRFAAAAVGPPPAHLAPGPPLPFGSVAQRVPVKINPGGGGGKAGLGRRRCKLTVCV